MLNKAINWQPELRDELVTLRPLQKSDFADLFHIASDPSIERKELIFNWRKKNGFQIYFDEAIASKNSMAILNTSSLKTIGYASYLDYSLKNSKVSIWFICLPNAGCYAYYVSTKKLLLKHAFKFVDNAHFYVGSKSIGPQAELVKIGAEKIKDFNSANGNKKKQQFEYVVTKTTWLRLFRPVL